MYFAKFPKIQYGGVELTDITRKVAFIEKLRASDHLSSSYTVMDGETPQSIAQDYYGSPEYDFVIILMNNIQDPFYDWVLDQNTFEQWLDEKYDNPDDIREYVFPDGRRFAADDLALEDNVGYEDAVAVSHRMYEEKMNEAKRNIRIVNPGILDDVMNEFEVLIAQ